MKVKQEFSFGHISHYPLANAMGFNHKKIMENKEPQTRTFQIQ